MTGPDPRRRELDPRARQTLGVLLLVAAAVLAVALLELASGSWEPVDGFVCPPGFDGDAETSTPPSAPVSEDYWCRREPAVPRGVALVVPVLTAVGLVVLAPLVARRAMLVAPAVLSVGFALLWILVIARPEEVQWSVVSGRPLRGRRARAARPPGGEDGGWERQAVDEAEAVRAFRQLADDLGHLGAPRELIRRADAAALEEHVHARRCADLAGVAVPEIPPCPRRRRASRRRELFDLAIASWRDGAVNEGAEVARLRALAAASSDPREAAAAREIADEEAGHAELAWDTIAWCRAEGGPGIDLVLRTVARSLRLPPGPGDGDEVRRQVLADARRRLWST